MELEILSMRPRDGAEVAERKGTGHPDTATDALAEALGVRLCREYLARFGRVLHFNVDKALVVGGSASPAFGGGELLGPVEVILAGRATAEVRGTRIPIEDLAREVVEDWFRANLRYPTTMVRVTTRIQPGSVDLVDLFGGETLANDTSFGVGHAPRSPLEAGLLAVEDAIRGSRNPAFGEDTKVMGVARGGDTALTLAIAMMGPHLKDAEAYEEARAQAARLAEAAVPGARVRVNAADGPGRWFLTVTGTSMEAGDDGQVGRGNRVNGLITPCRPMSLEAAAGKNPVTHVGKLYNLVADRAARVIAALPDVEEAECLLVSRIGHPVRDPWFAQVRVRGNAHPADVESLLRAELDGIPALTTAIVEGRARGC